MIWTRSHWWHCHCLTAVTLYFLWMHLIVCNYIQLGKLFYVPAFGSSSSVKFIRLNFLWNGDWVLLSWVREITCLSCPSIFEKQMLGVEAGWIEHIKEWNGGLHKPIWPIQACVIDHSYITRFHFLVWCPNIQQERTPFIHLTLCHCHLARSITQHIE